MLDCVTFYLNIVESFTPHLLFTHRYFCSTKNLFAGFRAHYVNASNLKAAATSPEGTKSAEKLFEQVQDRLGNVVDRILENHFYLLDSNRQELLKLFQTDLLSCLEATRRRAITLLLDGVLIIRGHPAGFRSKKSSVAVQDVIGIIFREDKSGVVMDRRKNLRLFKQCFVAVEAINLVMRKLKVSDRALVVRLLDSMRESQAIQNASKPEACFEDSDALWQFVHPSSSNSSSATIAARDAGGSDLAHPTLLEADAKVVAEQLTLIEFEAFVRIAPTEIYRQAWNKAEGSEAPNVMKLISSFNATTYWVASEVVSEHVFEKRVALLAKMIDVADRCLEIHNFQTLMEIIVGLAMGPVGRLTQTWDALGEPSKQKLKRLQALTSHSGNYGTYRRRVKEVSLPCFPYFGLVLKDLTFIEDGNETFNDDKKTVINWHKMTMIGTIFEEVQRYQQRSYDFEVKPHINAWLRSGRTIFTKDDELYAKSLQCQPRQTQ